MVWGCISAYGMGSLHALEGTMNAERYIKGFRATYAPLQTTCISGKAFVYFSRTMQNHILQILQQHGFVVEESGAELVSLQFRYRRTFGTSLNEKYVKDDHELFSS